MSFGIPYGLGDFPLDVFLRHVSYMNIAKANANGSCWGGFLFSRIMPSWVCHGYCQIVHMNLLGWFVGSDHRGGFVCGMIILGWCV